MNSQTIVAVCGSIGVGKTTLSQRLADKLHDAQYFQERGEDNPFLDLFYSDMERWGFHNRISFLNSHTVAYRNLNAKAQYIVFDRIIHEVAVFSKLQYDIGGSRGHEDTIYWSLYETLVHFIPQPDAIIYLRCSIDIALDRIKKRGHQYEQNMDATYLTSLQSYYDNWIAGFLPSRTLTIDTNHFDPRIGNLDEILAHVEKYRHNSS